MRSEGVLRHRAHLGEHVFEVWQTVLTVTVQSDLEDIAFRFLSKLRDNPRLGPLSKVARGLKQQLTATSRHVPHRQDGCKYFF